MADLEIFGYNDYSMDKSTDYSQVIAVFDNAEVLNEKFDSKKIAVLLNVSDDQEYEKLSRVAKKLKAGKESTVTVETHTLRGGSQTLVKVVFILLPDHFSRHNTPSRSHALAAAMKGRRTAEGTVVALFSSSPDHVYAQVVAIGRQFPTYSAKSSNRTTPGKVDILIDFSAGKVGAVASPIFPVASLASAATHTIESVRLAQELVDMPPNLLHSDAYINICRTIASDLGAQIEVIQGEDLQARGFGGIWGVGKAAEHLPALVILSYFPDSNMTVNDPSICLVGKGIMYDTGGLSIKTPTTSMAGMKMDMAGSAAVLGAFATAVRTQDVPRMPLHALLCIAENSIGPNATRPDDVHTFLSGKTVEVNNTDAEGRLVLADGVFYASKFLNARVIVDIATLTGAQLIATGRNHGAIYCNDALLEQIALECGRATGDLTFPVPYCPEFYRNEFRSSVADMKNSVADRSNAQVSCAGQFIGNHLEEFIECGGLWCHVDMAGPAMAGERATGYGVALLYAIAKKLNETDLE
jgi:probable aminopeptidase NPEPL1